MIERESIDFALMTLARAIAAGETTAASRLLAASPALANARFEHGATRASPKPYYLEAIGYYVYTGATALHVAAAAHRTKIVQDLIGMGADARARDRRGAEPLHAAAVGMPGSPAWDPQAQAATIACLLEAGADPNATDKGGMTPLHRAVRTRCARAVKALLEGGADAQRRNNNGSAPMLLATQNTGRGGSGSPAAKAEQQAIVRLLQQHGATRWRTGK
jgi:ankyrin repeat protein